MTGPSASKDFERPAPTCARCGTVARFLHVAPDSFTRGKFEIWSYECSNCSMRIEEIVAKEL